MLYQTEKERLPNPAAALFCSSKSYLYLYNVISLRQTGWK